MTNKRKSETDDLPAAKRSKCVYDSTIMMVLGSSDLSSERKFDLKDSLASKKMKLVTIPEKTSERAMVGLTWDSTN